MSCAPKIFICVPKNLNLVAQVLPKSNLNFEPWEVAVFTGYVGNFISNSLLCSHFFFPVFRAQFLLPLPHLQYHCENCKHLKRAKNIKNIGRV